MKAEDYSKLSFDERANMLWETGKYLESVDYYNQRINLYSLHSFFVEVYYNTTNNEIERMEVAGPEELKKFLGQIKIDVF